MSEREQIQVTISPDGEVSIEAIGFTGNTCTSATKPFEEGLGIVKQQRTKPEFHQTQVQSKTKNRQT